MGKGGFLTDRGLRHSRSMLSEVKREGNKFKEIFCLKFLERKEIKG